MVKYNVRGEEKIACFALTMPCNAHIEISIII